LRFPVFSEYGSPYDNKKREDKSVVLHQFFPLISLDDSIIKELLKEFRNYAYDPQSP